MVRHGSNFACVALLATAVAIPACSATAAAQTQSPAPPAATTPTTAGKPASTNPTRTHHKKKAEPVAETPQAPAPPPTLEQQSPAAPHVSYRNGLLTIDAPNSTLASILHAVQTQTGASMDLPPGAGADRVAMELGPGQPRDVLHTLLNGSKFDYMILGVAGQPGAVQKVILTPKTAGGATQAASAPQQAAPDEPQDDISSADSGGESEYPSGNEQQPMRPGGFRRPLGAPGAQAYQQQSEGEQNPPSQFGQQNDPNVVKTPEQLMQELQQMQQQQQQYQDQLNPANQNPQ